MNDFRQNGHNLVEQSAKGSPIDHEFWNFLDRERLFLLSNLFKKNSDLTWEDCEDIIGEFTEFYARQAYEHGSDARRFGELNRINLLSRVEWKKKDYLIRRNAKRRGHGVAHVSLDNEDFTERTLGASIEYKELGLSEAAEVLLDALNEAAKRCGGRRLGVVEALQRWLRGGCQGESWCEELLPREVEEYFKLKKGVSLEGKASPFFSAVKKILREIIEEKGGS